jgi:hypothetical protein
VEFFSKDEFGHKKGNEKWFLLLFGNLIALFTFNKKPSRSPGIPRLADRNLNGSSWLAISREDLSSRL